mgnify:CR=1 FL=1
MKGIQKRCIDDLGKLDFSKLTFEDLRWKYETFHTTSTGSGRYKEHGSWSGFMTGIGEIEDSVWYQASEKLIRQKGEQKILDALIQWSRENDGQRDSAEEVRKDALKLHMLRVFENPRWTGYVPFNRRYRPEVLEQAHLVTVISSCCGQPGEVTQEQIDAADGEAIACPCCGRWTAFTIVDPDSPEPEMDLTIK